VERQGGSLPGRDLSPLLHLYKARLALACHNHKAAKKEVRPQQYQMVAMHGSPGCCSALMKWCWANMPHSVLPKKCPADHVKLPAVFDFMLHRGCKYKQQSQTALCCVLIVTLAYVAVLLMRCCCCQVRALLSCEPDSTAAVLLKSQLEAMRHQPRKALKSLGPLLTAPPELTSRWVGTARAGLLGELFLLVLLLLLLLL